MKSVMFSSDTYLVLTLTKENLYCAFFKNNALEETAFFSSIDPVNNPALKKFLRLYDSCIIWIILDLPDLKIEHLNFQHLPFWKKYLKVQQHYYGNQCFYPLAEGLAYSHGVIPMKSPLWEEWAEFLKAQQIFYKGVFPLPYIWTAFPFKNYAIKKWQIILWKNPEEGLRYMAFFQETLIYSRLLKEVPFNLEEEMFDLYTYLKREYQFDLNQSVLLFIDFDPQQTLFSFPLDQEPIVINSQVLLKQYHLPPENIAYTLHGIFIQKFFKSSSVASLKFDIWFFIKNQYEYVFKNINKGLLLLLLYFMARGAYFYYQSYVLHQQYTFLKDNVVVTESLPLPEAVMKNLIISVPAEPLFLTNFIEKLKDFSSPFTVIEHWDWETLKHPDHYKINLKVQLELKEGENKKECFKRWKEHFHPLILTITKKKMLKKMISLPAQKWAIELTIEPIRP